MDHIVDIPMPDIAREIESRWIARLVASLTGKEVADIGPEEREEGLRMLLQWMENDELDLDEFPDDVRLAAMLELSRLHITALNDPRLMPPEIAAIGREAAARDLVLGVMRRRLRKVLQ